MTNRAPARAQLYYDADASNRISCEWLQPTRFASERRAMVLLVGGFRAVKREKIAPSKQQ